MAIRRALTNTANGTHYPEAHHVINPFTVDRHGKVVQFVVTTYRDVEAYQQGLGPVATKPFVVQNIPAAASSDDVAHPDFDELFSTAALSAEGVNPVGQCYVWLNRQSHYAGGEPA